MLGSRRYILVLSFLAATAMAGLAWGRAMALDLRGEASPSVPHGIQLLSASAPEDDGGTIRSTSLAAGATDVGAVDVGDVLSLTLFDDVSVLLTLRERMPSPLGGDVFLAEVEGLDGVKRAVVLRTEDGLTVDIQDFPGKKVYKVVTTADGVKVEEVESLGRGQCGSVGLAVDEAEGLSQSGGAASLLSAATPAVTAGTYVDMLVAFDRKAADWAAKNGGGITNFAQVAVQKMNMVLANTGLDARFRFRLVGVMRVEASSTSLETVLENVTSGKGAWSPVKAMRNKVGADIVTVLLDTGDAYGVTGLGWCLTSKTLKTFSEYAYNVCSIRSVAISHSMTHEVGHNMGAGHSDKMAYKADRGPQMYKYSSGYYMTGHFPSVGSGAPTEYSYHTIMAYDDDGYGNFYEELPYFSSASHTHAVNGLAIAVGDATHDNTRTLRNTYATVSGWRAQKVPEGADIPLRPDQPNVATSLELEPRTTTDSDSAVRFSGSQKIALSSCLSNAMIYYTLDGSEPVWRPWMNNSTFFYQGPFYVSETTLVRAVVVVETGIGIEVPSAVVEGLYVLDTSCYARWGEFETWGNACWSRVENGGYRSGAIGDGQMTWLGTAVEGAGVLSFRWKASSEKNFDFLRFYLDDKLAASVSGDTAWIERRHEIHGPGPHMLVWEFSKDDSLAGGGDCGWMDSFAWVPHDEIVAGAVLEQSGAKGTVAMSPKNGLLLSGGTATLTAKVGNKNTAFAYWVDETGRIVGYKSTLKVKVDGDCKYRAVFRLKSKCSRPVFDASAYGANGSESANSMVGVAFSAQMAVNESAYPVKFSAKGLPKGLKIDATTGVISGVPTKAGVFTATITAKSAANTKLKASSKKLQIVIAALPAWARGSFRGAVHATGETPLATVSAQDVPSPSGLATITVGATGKISGKVACCGTNWTFSASGYSVASVATRGLFMVSGTASCKVGKKTVKKAWRVEVKGQNAPVAAAGTTAAVGTLANLAFEARRDFWKDKDSVGLLADWAGAYRWLTQDGNALTLTLDAKGAVKVVGTVDGGRKLSLSTVLEWRCADGGASYHAYIYAEPTTVTKKDKKGKVVGKVSYPAFIADVDLVNWPGEPVAGRAVAFRKQGVRPVVGGSSTGTGTFSFSPAYGQASSNATVTVTATAAQGSVFACWILDGVIVGYGPSCKVTMREGDFTGLMAVFHQAVAEVPEWVTGAYSGKGELGGKPAAVSFTVGTGGKVSGKFTVAKKSYAFSTSAVAEYGGALHATAPLVYGKKKYFVRLDFFVEDGGGTFAQIDVMRTDGYALEDGVAVSSFGRAWKK